ncbi:MarR family winged helix-turn-helix transcriptional regulator [Solicola sp. PLA-1-18]|uniref:MarR family winged helix-turn-helix transcriptional regulator n=1 Tax=Solicola sp. PLA-1-18 TaxID=3380532 RepID=UPI003B786C9A
MTARQVSPRARLAEVERLQVAVIQLARQLGSSYPGDLPRSARTALAAVVKYGPLRVGDLAEREGVGQTAISRTLRHLEADGLVSRSPDPRDGRVWLVDATDRGRTRFLDDRRLLSEQLVTQLHALPEGDLTALLAAAGPLEQMIELTRR